MDDIEITVFDEIKDYKEKIYFFNFRQWVFAILIVGIVVPTYIYLKDIIGEEMTSYIVIAIAGILGFIGFVKIHELPAEKIIPFWFRHYFYFSKPLHYLTDEEFKLQHQKKHKIRTKNKKNKLSKIEKRELKKKNKHEKLLMKAKRRYELPKAKVKNKKDSMKKNKKDDKNELAERLSKLTKEQQEALLKLLER